MATQRIILLDSNLFTGTIPLNGYIEFVSHIKSELNFELKQISLYTDIFDAMVNLYIGKLYLNDLQLFATEYKGFAPDDIPNLISYLFGNYYQNYIYATQLKFSIKIENASISTIPFQLKMIYGLKQYENQNIILTNNLYIH